MKKIAIIGSGIAGLLTAHGLLRAGYGVTVYSDRSSVDWLHNSRPTGTAARFEMALSYERELGLNFWEQQAPAGEGLDLIYSERKANPLITLKGRFAKPFLAIDVRLQSARWLDELQARGGRLELEAVTLARLDAISSEHDLTLVASGRSELAQLFPCDARRSAWDKPQRHLAMVVAKGAGTRFADLPLAAVKFHLLAKVGETFWVPYWHKDGYACWNLGFEARPGGPLDRFGTAKSGAEVLQIGQQIIREFFPWDAKWAESLTLADENGWLVGGFAPLVRQGVAQLPSGRYAMPLGDSAIAHDPIAGQGANSGQKMARHVVERIVAHGDKPFDRAFIEQTFDDYYQQYGRYSYGFSNLLLEPLPQAAQELMLAQYGSTGLPDDHSGRQAIADAFCANFNDPRYLTDLLTDLPAARRFIAEKTGKPWLWVALAGRMAVMRDQVRRRWVG